MAYEVVAAIPGLVSIMDLLALVVALAAAIYAILTPSFVIGSQFKQITWSFAIGLFFTALRKVFDALGEWVFTSYNTTFNFLEDIAFLIGLCFLLYSAVQSYKFFKSIRLK